MRILEYFFSKENKTFTLIKIRNGTFEIDCERKTIIILSTKAGIYEAWERIKSKHRKPTFQEELDAKVAAVTKEQRQQILDLLHEGKTIGEVDEIMGLETIVTGQIICDNIDNHSFLRTEVKQ